MSLPDILAYAANIRGGLKLEAVREAFNAAETALLTAGAPPHVAATGARWVIDVMRRRVADKKIPLGAPNDTPEKAAAFWFAKIYGEV